MSIEKDLTNHKNFSLGFTLLELAMALVIIGLIALSFRGVFELFYNTDHRLEQIEKNRILKESIETYLIVNSRLPCPDVTGDGKEDMLGYLCSASSGALPFDDLGVEQLDAWSNAYFYQVIPSAIDNSNKHACHMVSVFIEDSTSIETTNSKGLKYCAETNEFSCNSSILNCPTSAQVDAKLSRIASPHFSLFTLGTFDYDSSGTIEADEMSLILNDENGNKVASEVLALIISWGSNGDEAYYGSCPSDLNANEKKNCDANLSVGFVKTETGLTRDYVIPITLHQAKRAIVNSRRFE